MSSLGVGVGLAHGVQNVTQLLGPMMRQKMANQQHDKELSARALPYLTRGGAGPSSGPSSATLSPAQALVAQGTGPNSLTMDQRMAGVANPLEFSSSDLEDVRTTTAPEPTKGIPDIGTPDGHQELLGHVAVGHSVDSFRKQTEDVGRNFITAQKKTQEAQQKLNAAKQSAEMALQTASTKYAGNMSQMMSDPHVQAAQKSFIQARIDHQQSLQDFKMYGDKLHELLPGLGIYDMMNPGQKTMPNPTTMQAIGQSAYAPNDSPAQFLTPGMR